jgi:transcription initiation factor TFIIH subunit 4
MVLQEYLNGCEKRQMDKGQVLQFLFELSFLEVGREYTTKHLTVTQKAFLADLSEFGIIYQKSGDDSRFYPTIFATGLIDSENVMDWTIKDHGHIIIETNFRIYAYTASPLQISILDLFSELEYRTPNLVVGSLTRESLRFVYSKGVTSDQIIDYVYKHAHVQMKSKRPIIPETITDQLRLWEKEKKRIRFEDGILWADFPTQEVFKSIEAEAIRQRLVLFTDSKGKVIVSHADSMEQMKEIFRQYAK